MADVTPPAPPPPAAPATAPAPAPAPAKPSVLPKILIGCLGVVVLVGLLLAAGAWWFFHRIGLTDASKNPAALAARLMVAGNPEFEVSGQDDARQTVTIRNKKTGETVTLNAAELQQGKLELTGGKGEKVTFDGSAEKGELRVETKEGTTVVGGGKGTAPMPSWVPAYPGAEPAGTLATTGPRGVQGGYAFQTPDAVEQVLARFEAALKGTGFEVQRSSSGEGAGVLSGKQSGGRVVNVSAMKDEKGTTVTVQYEEVK